MTRFFLARRIPATLLFCPRSRQCPLRCAAHPVAQSDAKPLKTSSCEDSIGCMHGSSEPDLRNWKSPIP
ncbi:hypothetical protein EJA41_15890, partial [Bordetella pertussis]